MSEHLTFAIDFDGCFEEDPELFRHFVSMLRDRGHSAYIFTNRKRKQKAYVNEVVETPDFSIEVIYCGEFAKAVTARRRGINVDIWLDDNPESILLFQE